MLSEFAYDDTDWGMMSAAPDTESGHYFGTDPPAVICWCVWLSAGVFSLMVGLAAALVAALVGNTVRRDVRLCRRQN